MLLDFATVAELDVSGTLDRLSNAPPLTIVVPVFNGGSAVGECLDALRRNATGTHRILLIDDASTDPAIVALLNETAAHAPFELIRHRRNLGYTATVNEAIATVAPDDVLLLNSDATIPPLAWQRMRAALYSHPSGGTASAVSDWAGTLSMPVPHQGNVWHPKRPWDDIGRLLMRGMPVWTQESPTGHGFCFLISRALIDEIGAFDQAAFPLGYGEEVDFSQRALRAGFVNLVVPSVIARHRRSQSFGTDARTELIAASRPVLAARYPALLEDVANWETSVGDLFIRATARRVQHTRAGAVAERVLLVMPADAAPPPTLRIGDLAFSVRDGDEPVEPASTTPVSARAGVADLAGALLANAVERVRIARTLRGAAPVEQLQRASRLLGVPVDWTGSAAPVPRKGTGPGMPLRPSAT